LYSTNINLKNLYKIDNYQWLESTIKILRNQDFSALDLENLIEELENVNSEKRNNVINLLEQIIRNLLLLEYWLSEQEYNREDWLGEIYTFRIELKRKLTPNLRNYLANELDSIYQDALGFVQIKTKNSVDFTDNCPYSLEQLLDIKYIPDDYE
ncbi:MAG TPA: DUF29 domain-containing protein, partial [Allocoleopsis sp.]